MRFLSIDIEATGLNEDCLIIEFAAIPFDSQDMKLEDSLSFHHFVQCPSFESLEPKLDQWVKDHNKELITKAHQQGLPMNDFKNAFMNYLESEKIKNYFNQSKIVIFGKSLNAIDLPFLNRDLSWNFMRKYFHHRVLDLSSFSMGLVDLNQLPGGSDSGSKLMNYLNMGEVSHTALEDAKNTALMYLKLIQLCKKA